jgi:hypothetical protein
MEWIRVGRGGWGGSGVSVVVAGLCAAGCGSQGGAGSEADEDAQVSSSESGESGDTEAPGDTDATGSESDTTTTTDRESEGDTEIEPPSGECSTAPGDHSASCPDEACPIVVDVEIVCDEDRFGVSGVRVAADDDSTIAVAGGDNFAWMFDAAADGAVTTSPLPEGFASTALHLAQATDGSVRLLADTTTFASPGMFEGGVVMLAPDGDDWSEEDVWGSPEHYTRIVDFELVDDVPHAWFPTTPPEELSLGVRAEDGTWDVDVVELVADGGGWQRFTVVDGLSIPHDLVETGMGTRALTSRIDGQDVVWESSDVQRRFVQYRLPPGAGLEADAATWSAAIVSEDGVRVVSGPGAGTAFDLPDTASPEHPCGWDLEPPNCDIECDYQATGQANEREGFAIARTDDGTLWVALAVIHYDQHWSYWEDCPEETDCYCNGSADADASTGELRLYRIGADGTSGELMLTVPTGVPATSDTFENGFAIDLRAWGDDLALGVKALTQPGQINGAGAHQVRLLRIDTALLPAE